LPMGPCVQRRCIDAIIAEIQAIQAGLPRELWGDGGAAAEQLRIIERNVLSLRRWQGKEPDHESTASDGQSHG
jgi:hypothetical protein